MDLNKNIKKDTYNYGIDVLKIIATLMIITMHILLQGGIIRNVSLGSVNYYIVWIIETFCFVGVNLYALSTGFLYVKKDNIKMSSFFKRWLQVFFYTFFFTALFAIIKPEVMSLKSWIKACVPVLANQYWYFTQYFVLFMVMPFLNKMINSLDKASLKKLVLAIIFVLSLIPTVRQYDIFFTENGYSAWWLMALYIVGGYLALYKDELRFSKKTLWLVIILSNLIAVGGKFIMDHMDYSFESFFLIEYTSILVVLSSIAITILCINMKIKTGRNIIKFLGTLTFGVYLIHVNYFIWNYIMKDAFVFLATLHPGLLLLGLVGCCLGIFAVAAVVEFLRVKLFEVIRLNRLAEWCGVKYRWIVDNFIMRRL